MRPRRGAESSRAYAIQPRSGLPADGCIRIIPPLVTHGRVAQLVEQGIENPRVGGSIPSPATMYFKTLQNPHKLRVFRLCQKRSIDPTSGAAQVIHQRQYADAPFNGGRAVRVFHRCVA